jgi:hypothetical protein
MSDGRRLHIPDSVPEEFAQAVATILLLGIAGQQIWEEIYRYPPETSLTWIEEILEANDSDGLLHPSIEWWENQVLGH